MRLAAPSSTATSSTFHLAALGEQARNPLPNESSTFSRHSTGTFRLGNMPLTQLPQGLAGLSNFASNTYRLPIEDCAPSPTEAPHPTEINTSDFMDALNAAVERLNKTAQWKGDRALIAQRTSCKTLLRAW